MLRLRWRARPEQEGKWSTAEAGKTQRGDLSKVLLCDFPSSAAPSARLGLAQLHWLR